MDVINVSCKIKLSVRGVMQDITGQRASSTNSEKDRFLTLLLYLLRMPFYKNMM